MSSSLAFKSSKLPPYKGHPLVLSRLRPRKRKLTSPSPPISSPLVSSPLATLIRRTQPKRARHRRNSSSPPPALASLYYITVESSPYIFDEEFYTNNPSILNTAIDADITNYRAIYNHYIKRLREAHKKIIDSTILEAFRPIKLPDLPRLIRAYLPDSCIVKDPISFFEIFLRNEDYNLIITNTNKYTIEYLTLYPGNSHRVFKPTNQ
jgi:hypothetical protein